MKKKLTILSLLALCFTFAVSGSLAYFTVQERSNNVVTSGSVEVEIREWTEPGQPFPEDGVEDVMPGTSHSKIVEVANIGPESAWVRVKVNKSYKGVAGDPDLIQLEGVDTENWAFREEDGYYYYKKELLPDAVTEPLFKGVMFDPMMGNSYQNSKAFVAVHVESVQTKNNGSTVFEAAGWPK